MLPLDRTPGPDVSARFAELLAREEVGEDVLPVGADRYVYLVVGGIFTDHYPGYMTAVYERLHRSKLDSRPLPVDTEAGVDANASFIREFVLRLHTENGRKAVLIGHSKGGVDIGAALSLFPELLPAVHAVITIGAPYWGSALAEAVIDDPTAASLAAQVLRWLSGDPEALLDMGRARRAVFNAAHPYPRAVPTLSFASSADGGTVSPMWPLIHHLLSLANQPNDGMVYTPDAIFPGADVVCVHDIDHAETALRGFSGVDAHDPGAIMAVLVTLVLERAARG